MRKLAALLWIALLIISLLSMHPVKAQSSGEYWAKTYGGGGDDWAKAVAVAPNGDLIVAGYTYSFGAGDKDAFVMKLSPDGKVLWAKTYGGGGDDEAWTGALAPNGDIIVAGVTTSFGAGHWDVWVLKLDPNGNVIWQKTYGGGADDWAKAVAIAPNGDIIVAGGTASFGGAWVLRLDENGNVIWQKTYGGNDWANAVAIAPNGDIIVAGATRSFGAGYSDAWVLRLDRQGNIIWQKTYGGSGGDEADAVAIAPNGDLIVAGYTYSFGADPPDVWVLRLDRQGNIIWQKTYGGNVDDHAYSLALAPNSDIIVAGYTASFGVSGDDVWVLRLDSNGNVIWQKTYGRRDNLNGYWGVNVALAPNGDIIMASGTSGFGAGCWDAWVLRLPPDGNLPGCKFCGDSNAQVENTDAQVSNTNAIVKNSNATVENSNAVVKTWNPTVETQYYMVVRGYLSVSSSPSGAKVYINGTYDGTTPLILNLMPGTYTLKLTKDNYQDYVKTVTVYSNETTTVSATLTPNFGYLNVSSTPSGAKVYINGTYEGITPLTLNLTPGTYTVRLFLNGYKNYMKTATITAGEKTSLSASLTPLPSSTSTSSAVASTSSPSSTVTPAVKTSEGFNYVYIFIALIGLLAVGGVAVKIKGGKSKPSPPKENIVAPTPAPTRKVEAKPQTSPNIPDFPPELLDKYEPLEFLGEGGFAKVFKAKRRKDGKIVALKIPRIDEKTSKTFIKEVSTWLHLDHPNIVKLYDVDILPIPYLEMEYVGGVEIDGKVIRDLGGYPKPLPEAEALSIIRGIAGGLKHAHSKGIYHRDLKPLNILLKADLTPKITDWGLAKLGTMSSSRSVLGYTPLYASPEHLLPSKYGHTDHRTDIWQLGVTFYELLTGRLPFEGYTYEEVFGKIVDEGYRFTPPSKVNPELAKYDGIFEKLLAKNKEERYQSVEEFLKDLDRLEESEKRKAELEKEVEKLKKTLARTVSALKESRSAEEALKNRRLVVETLGKLALAYAELNRKAELLNTLNDLKFYTVQNLNDLLKAIETVELFIKEDLSINPDFTEKLKVLVHNIKRENGA